VVVRVSNGAASTTGVGFWRCARDVETNKADMDSGKTAIRNPRFLKL
jgi:hypothetical protein